MIIFIIEVEEVKQGIMLDMKPGKVSEDATRAEHGAATFLHNKMKDIGAEMLKVCNGFTAEGPSAQFLVDQLRGEKKDVDRGMIT